MLNGFKKWFIFSLFILIFLEYTYARGPSDYCNNIESPPAYFVIIDQNRIPHFYKNTEFTQTLAHLSSVNQNLLVNIVDGTASYGTSGKELNID